MRTLHGHLATRRYPVVHAPEWVVIPIPLACVSDLDARREQPPRQPSREQGEDQLELAAADEHERGVGGRSATVAVDPGGEDARGDVERERDDDRDRDRQRDRAHVARRDRQPEPEDEKIAANVSPSGTVSRSTCRPIPVPATTIPGQERSDGVRGARAVSEPRDEHPKPTSKWW